jgi:Protein of unknown function (DUF3093)
MSPTPRFSEWQLPNFSSFLPHLLIAPAIWMTLAPFNPDLGLIVGLLLTAATVALRFAVARRIIVTETSLLLGKATLPLEFIGKVESIPKEEQFFARGALADPRAFFQLKSGLPDLVRIQITDPSDPTPYALVSCRKASEFIAALDEAKPKKRKAK